MQKPVYTLNNQTLFFSTNFNEPMDPYYYIIKDITIIIFGEIILKQHYSLFNQPIVFFPKIQTFISGYEFNQPIVLTKTMRVLRLGTYFNQPIVLQPCVTHVIFWTGGCFNQTIILNKKNPKCHIRSLF